VLSHVSWGRCIFRCGVCTYLIIIQSKNKILREFLGQERWALPGAETLQVARTPLLSVRPFNTKVRDSFSWRKGVTVLLSFVTRFADTNISRMASAWEISDLREW
jgi:hypothetical protein